MKTNVFHCFSYYRGRETEGEGGRFFGGFLVNAFTKSSSFTSQKFQLCFKAPFRFSRNIPRFKTIMKRIGAVSHN